MNYMIYIMSDIHGLYDRYLKMLQKIDLQKEDKLYILGDVIDRGDMGIDILIDLMERDNVELFLGNHEHMMLTYLNGMDRISWFYEANGGMVTYKHFMALNEEKREDILAYLYDTAIVKHLDINSHHYVLSHTGAPEDGKDIYTHDYFYDLMKIQDLVWNHYPYSIDLLNLKEYTGEEKTFISGHIVTRRLHDSDKVYIQDFGNGYTWINIDCGCALGKGYGYLSCLVIDDSGEIRDILYVS